LNQSIHMKMQNLRNDKKDPGRSDKLTNVLFIVYLIGLFWLIVLKFNVAFLWLGEERSFNFIPFAEPLILNGKIDYPEMILNAVVFVPFGIYTGILFRRWSFGKHLLLFFSFSLLCEVLQYLLGVGAADITDVINNSLGGAIGLLLLKGIEKISGNIIKTQKFINIIATIVTVLIIAFLLFLRIKELWLFRMYTIQR
jgi:glycopeptide antibiotics resistance protein